MSEETKEPVEETPETAEAAQQAPETQETEKKAKKKEKKEKGITFTREQVEKMELAAKQLESVKDQFTRLTAEYDNYRKRTDTTDYVRYADKLKQSGITASVYSILNSLVKSVTGCGKTAYNKAVHKQYKASQPPVLCLFSCQNTECYVAYKDKYHYGSRNCDPVLEI